MIIYGVKSSFSNQLKSVSTSYVEMPRQSQEKNHYYDLIFVSLNRLRSRPRTLVTYWKTVNNVAEYNKVPKERVQRALDNLMRQKYITESRKTGYRGRKIDVLTVDWDKVEKDGIWNG